MLTRIYITLLAICLSSYVAMARTPDAGAEGAPDTFVQLILSTEKTYVGEAFVASLVIYTTHEIERLDTENALIHDSFEAKELKLGSIHTSYQQVDGKQYLTGVVRRWILIPTKKGKQTIECEAVKSVILEPRPVNYGFFSAYEYERKEVIIPGCKSEIRVESLPGKKPAGFSGSVGLFEDDVKLSQPTLTVGEEASLTYTISGIGNPGVMDTPTLSLPDFIDVKESDHTTEVHLTGKNIVGTYTAIYRIVASKAGRYSIEVPEFIYFNPSTGKYDTLSKRKIDLRVAYGEVFEM